MGIRALITVRGVREVIALLATTGVLYLLVALLGYSPEDGGWSHYGGDTAVVSNTAGLLGAWLSDALYAWLGVSALLLPLLLLHALWRWWRQQVPAHPLLATPLLKYTLWLCLLVSVSALTAIHAHSGLWPNGAGGVLGQEVGSLVHDWLGLDGGSLLLLALLLASSTLILEFSWLELMDRIGEGVLQLLERGIALGQHFYQRRFPNQPLREEQDKRMSGASMSSAATRHEPVISPILPQYDDNLMPLPVEQRPAATPMPREVRRVPEIQLPETKPAAKPSRRVEKEKQQSLFDAPVTGALPPLSLLDAADQGKRRGFSRESLEAMSRLLELKLKDFGIEAEVMAVHPGPVITRFEIHPAPGIKVSRISGLAKDLARSLAVISVRVVEVIPGKPYVGIEIPNEDREMVRLHDVLSSEGYEASASPLSLALGKDISGTPVIVDLARMPHLLVAGTTGSGKSVGVNAMLLSMLFKAGPGDLRLIMIDPKMLELSVYDGIPHLLTPVVTDMKEAASALRWCVAEMERRYKLMATLGVRNLAGYNKKVLEAEKNGGPIRDPLWKADEHFTDDAPTLSHLPFIVVVIDEFADMMMIVGKKVEELIARIAQKARAAGIHLILATQRPSVDVITGLIKANIPSRIAFQVSSKIDSRTILDQGGAEQLLGHGDMLYLPTGKNIPERVHGAFVDDDEVHRVCNDWRRRGSPDYVTAILETSTEGSIYAEPGQDGEGDPEADPLYDEAVAFVMESRRASISSVQRKLKIGYNRAARLIEAMEMAGLVSAMQSNGSRDVLVPDNR